MASVVFNSAISDVIGNRINFGTDTFKVMLVTAAYTPDKNTHKKRSAVTGEVTGQGYTAGGLTTTVDVAEDLANSRDDISFGNVAWVNSTLSARGAVIYKALGGAASADPLVAYVDFGEVVTSQNSAFAATFSSPLRFQN